MITIELKDAEVTRMLARLMAAMSDMTTVMGDIGADLVATTEDRFKIGQAPDGSAWVPRSPTTLEAYGRQGLNFGPYPLTRSGEMSNNISHAFGSDFAEVGSNVIQAAVMQFGEAQGAARKKPPIPWGTIPARPFLGISEIDRSNIIETVNEWLTRLAAGGDGA